jgi:hypothetical protein
VRAFLPDKFIPSLQMYQRLRKQLPRRIDNDGNGNDHDLDDDNHQGGASFAMVLEGQSRWSGSGHSLSKPSRKSSIGHDNKRVDEATSSDALSGVADDHFRREVTLRFIAAMKVSPLHTRYGASKSIS